MAIPCGPLRSQRAPTSMRNCDASGSPFLNGTFLEKIAQVAFGLPLRGKLLPPNTWFATAFPPQNALREQITVLLVTQSECKDDQSIMVAFFSRNLRTRTIRKTKLRELDFKSNHLTLAWLRLCHLDPLVGISSEELNT